MLHYNAPKLRTCRLNTNTFIFLYLAKHPAVCFDKEYRIACLTANFVISNIDYICVFAFHLPLRKFRTFLCVDKSSKDDEKQRWKSTSLVKQKIVYCLLFYYVCRMDFDFPQKNVYFYTMHGKYLENPWIFKIQTIEFGKPISQLDISG